MSVQNCERHVRHVYKARILFLVHQSSRTYGFRSADVHEWAVAYESAHAELKTNSGNVCSLKIKIVP